MTVQSGQEISSSPKMQVMERVQAQIKAQAGAAYRAGDFGRAADILRIFACLFPSSAPGYANRLAAQRRTGAARHSLVRSCRQALFADPHAPGPLVSLLTVLAERYSPPSADASADMAPDPAPSDIAGELDIFLGRHALDAGVARAYAILLYFLGEGARAKAGLRRALLSAPAEASLYRQLAIFAQEEDFLCDRNGRRRNIHAWSLCSAAANSREFMEAASDLAVFLQSEGRLREAEALYRAALRGAPDSEIMYANFCNVLADLGLADEAEREVRRLLVRWPDSKEGLWLSSCLRLGAGDMRGGYRAHHIRWSESYRRNRPSRFDGTPLWLGQEVAGRDILVWRNFGIGEEILFAPLACLLARRGARVTLELDPRLVSLARRSFPEITVRAHDARAYEARAYEEGAEGSVSGFAYHAPVTLLARFLLPEGTRGDLLPHWKADENRVRAIRAALARHGDGPFVGIAWGGGGARTSWSKNTGLSEWQPVLELPGMRFVNLQYTKTPEADGYQAPHLLPAPVEDLRDDLEGLAALVEALDCVISISGVNAHMAGALGRPGFVLLPKLPFWFWGRSGARSLRYPGLRLYRRGEARPAAQIAAIARDLRTFLGP